MTRRARAWFFAALATLLGPLVLPDEATTATEVRTTVAPAAAEEEALPVSSAWPAVLATPASDLPEASSAGSVAAPVESLPPRPITTATGADRSGLPGSEPFRSLHPARGPPRIS